MQPDTDNFPLAISPPMEKIIKNEIRQAHIPIGKGVILSFRRPNASLKKQYNHPVEIAITTDGEILYITDFIFTNCFSYEELIKNQDFDASEGLFQHGGKTLPLTEGTADFIQWQRNFCAHYRMGLFQAEVALM